MFKEFFNSLMINSNNDSDNIQETGMLSLTAIFIRIAKLDGVFDSEELEVIRTFLKKRYNLVEQDIDNIISEASKLESNLNDNVQLTKKIKNTIDFEDRFDLLQDAWRLIIADGKRSYQEDSFMRLFCGLLGLSDKDNAIARKNIINK
ncbi:MAG: hypothetical protein CML36_05970 [Rhodobacteraceae bacterium]|mgnify:FL=1|nr:hypothetical protein [Paracoccaceae bacterium]